MDIVPNNLDDEMANARFRHMDSGDKLGGWMFYYSDSSELTEDGK